MSVTKSSFFPPTLLQQVRAYIDLAPVGKLMEGQSVTGSIFNSFLTGLSKEMQRNGAVIFDLINKYIPNFTNSLIEQWEQEVGIPDDTFRANLFTDEERRRNILIKLAFMNLQTNDDYIKLATLLGLTITVRGGSTQVWPYTWPILWGSAYMIIITVLDTPQNDVWPYTWPLQWPNNNLSLFETICQLQKPANYAMVFQYESS